MSIDLRKRIVDLRKKAAFAAHNGIEGQRAQVVLVLDISVSMNALYKSGVIQPVIERILGLTVAFDDDGQIELLLVVEAIETGQDCNQCIFRTGLNATIDIAKTRLLATETAINRAGLDGYPYPRHEHHPWVKGWLHLVLKGLDMKILFSILTGVTLALTTVGTLAEKNAATPEESRITIPEKDCTYGPHTCRDGFVWRRAVPSDTVCVTPEVRTQTHIDNAKAGERRNPNGGRRGPNTCLPGYVWRKAFPGDVVCVKPRVRAQAAQDNRQANARKACR